MKKFVSLLSTGLDSPVASFLMIKKKWIPTFLSFLTFEDENPTIKEKVIQLVKILSKDIATKTKLYIVYYDSNLDEIKQDCERKLTCILCKRLMLRIAIQIANIEDTNIIVMGDILGEQASQTLDNIYGYNNLIKENIIIRPLIGWDKNEVIKLNKELGLYDIISNVPISCKYNPKYPETHAKLKEITSNESKIKIPELIKKAINSMELIEI